MKTKLGLAKSIMISQIVKTSNSILSEEPIFTQFCYFDVDMGREVLTMEQFSASPYAKKLLSAIDQAKKDNADQEIVVLSKSKEAAVLISNQFYGHGNESEIPHLWYSLYQEVLAKLREPDYSKTDNLDEYEDPYL